MVSFCGIFQEIMFLVINVILFIYMDSALASKYYYKEVNGKYDIYYGDNADCGYKEFKPPKSFKIGHKNRGQRPGNCIKPQFQCTSPYSVKDTKFFECEVDFQCPKLFKCCEVHCFQHKICQPIELKEVDEGDISYYYDYDDDGTTEVTTKHVFTDDESTEPNLTTQHTIHSTESDTIQSSTISISSTEETSQNTLSSEHVFTDDESTTFNPSTKLTTLQSSTTFRTSSFRTTPITIRTTTEKTTPITFSSHQSSQSTRATDDDDKSTTLSSLFSTQSSTEIDKTTPTTIISTMEKITANTSPSDQSSQTTRTTGDGDKSTTLSSLYSTQSSTEIEKTTSRTTSGTTEKTTLITFPSHQPSQSTTTKDDDDKSTKLSSVYSTESSTEIEKTTPTTISSTTEKISGNTSPSDQSSQYIKTTQLSSLYSTESSTRLDETTHPEEKLTSTTSTSNTYYSSDSTSLVSQTTPTQTTISITKTSQQTTTTGSPLYTTKITTRESDETTTEKAASIHSTLTVTNTKSDYTPETAVTTKWSEPVTSSTYTVTAVTPTVRTTTYRVPITETDTSETSRSKETPEISPTTYSSTDFTYTEKTMEDISTKQSTFTTTSLYSDPSDSTASQSIRTQPSTVTLKTTSSSTESSTPQITKISPTIGPSTSSQSFSSSTTSKSSEQTYVTQAKESTILESTTDVSTWQPQSTSTDETIVSLTTSPVYSKTTSSHGSSSVEHITSSSAPEFVTKPQTSSSAYSNSPELSTITTPEVSTKYVSTTEVPYTEKSDKSTRVEHITYTTDITSDDEDDITFSGDFETNTIFVSESTSSGTESIVTSFGSVGTTEAGSTEVVDTSDVALTTQSQLTSKYSESSSVPTIKSSTEFTNPTSIFPSDYTLTETQSSPSKSGQDITSDDEDLTFSGDFEVATTNTEEYSTLYMEDTDKITINTEVSSTFAHISNTYNPNDISSQRTSHQDVEIISSDKPVGSSTQEYLRTTEIISTMFAGSDTPKQTDSLKHTTPYQVIDKSTLSNTAESFTTTSVDKFTSSVPEPNSTPVDVTGDDEDLVFSGDSGSGLFDDDAIPENLSTLENEPYKNSKVTQITTDDDFSFTTELDHKQEVPGSLLKTLTRSTEEIYTDTTRTTLETTDIKSTYKISHEFDSFSTEEVTPENISEPVEIGDNPSSPASKITTGTAETNKVTTTDYQFFTHIISASPSINSASTETSADTFTKLTTKEFKSTSTNNIDETKISTSESTDIPNDYSRDTGKFLALSTSSPLTTTVKDMETSEPLYTFKNPFEIILDSILDTSRKVPDAYKNTSSSGDRYLNGFLKILDKMTNSLGNLFDEGYDHQNDEATTTRNVIDINCKESADTECVTAINSELAAYKNEEVLPTLTTRLIVEVEN